MDLQLDHTTPAVTLHFQNTILSENYTPGQMIADNSPVWLENAMNNLCKGFRLKKGRGYALPFQMMDNTIGYQEAMSK